MCGERVIVVRVLSVFIGFSFAGDLDAFAALGFGHISGIRALAISLPLSRARARSLSLRLVHSISDSSSLPKWFE